LRVPPICSNVSFLALNCTTLRTRSLEYKLSNNSLTSFSKSNAHHLKNFFNKMYVERSSTLSVPAIESKDVSSDSHRPFKTDRSFSSKVKALMYPNALLFLRVFGRAFAILQISICFLMRL